MLKFDGKELRNLEEQVLKNQEDIDKILKEIELADLGIKVVQAVPLPSAEDLPLPYDGSYGDGFLVGSETPYRLYIWTRDDNAYNGTWFDFGPLNAPSIIPGPQGEPGETGPQGERGSLWTSNNGVPTVSQNNKNGDQFLNTATGNVYEYQNGVWNITGNIKGPQGIQGIQGPKGDIGERGLQGIQGPKGDPGQWIQIIAELANIDQLPAPDSVPRYYAYIIPVDGVKHLYIISGDETLLWLDCGAFTGPQGETGPQGQQGIQGVAGVGIASVSTGASSQTANGYTQTPVTFTKTDNSVNTINIEAKNGPTVTSITAGTPTSSDGYTTTPITFNYSDNTNQTVGVLAKEAEHLYRHSCDVRFIKFNEIPIGFGTQYKQYAFILRFEVFNTSSTFNLSNMDSFTTWFTNHGTISLSQGSVYNDFTNSSPGFFNVYNTLLTSITPSDTDFCTYTAYKLNKSSGTDADGNTFLKDTFISINTSGSVPNTDYFGNYSCTVNTTMVL